MKLTLPFLIAATAAAAAAPAEVFIFDPAVPDADSAQTSREVARLILAHRLRDAPDDSGTALPHSVYPELDSHINAYGKPRQSLFSVQRAQREPQLVILVEGVASDNIRELHESLAGARPAFTIDEPPSEAANQDLLTKDFSAYTGTWLGPNSCPLNLAINPREPRCWRGDALIVKYDAMKVRFSTSQATPTFVLFPPNVPPFPQFEALRLSAHTVPSGWL